MSSTEVLDSLGDLGGDWDALVDLAPLPSPFLRSWWLETVAGARPRYVVVRDGAELIGGIALEEDRPVGVARLRPIGVLLGADQLDLVAQPGREEDVVDALRQWIAGRGGVIIDLPGCYERARLPSVLHRPAVEVVDVAPWTPLPASFSALLAERSGELRSQIDRPRRRLAREGAVHRVVTVDELPRALADLRRLHAEVFGDASQFLPVFDRFARAAPAGLGRGELVMHEFAVDGRAIAINVCFEVAGRLSYYQIGRDLDRRWRGSGTALMAHCVEHAIDAGCREFDLMRGSEGYKRLWADQARDVIRLQSAQGLSGRLAHAVLPMARRARSLGGRLTGRRARGNDGRENARA